MVGAVQFDADQNVNARPEEYVLEYACGVRGKPVIWIGGCLWIAVTDLQK